MWQPLLPECRNTPCHWRHVPCKRLFDDYVSFLPPSKWARRRSTNTALTPLVSRPRDCNSFRKSTTFILSKFAKSMMDALISKISCVYWFSFNAREMCTALGDYWSEQPNKNTDSQNAPNCREWYCLHHRIAVFIYLRTKPICFSPTLTTRKNETCQARLLFCYVAITAANFIVIYRDDFMVRNRDENFLRMWCENEINDTIDT